MDLTENDQRLLRRTTKELRMLFIFGWTALALSAAIPTVVSINYARVQHERSEAAAPAKLRLESEQAALRAMTPATEREQAIASSLIEQNSNFIQLYESHNRMADACLSSNIRGISQGLIFAGLLLLFHRHRQKRLLLIIDSLRAMGGSS